MPLFNLDISEREKAALAHHVYGGCNDWHLLFRIADSIAFEDSGRIRHFDTYVSRWKNSPKVKNYIEHLRKIRADQDAEERNKGKEEERKAAADRERIEEQKPKAVAAMIDYSNPENQRRKLNELVNKAEDSKDALDALKTIIAGQRDDKQAAREQKQVRAYLPLQCNECLLMIREREKSGL